MPIRFETPAPFNAFAAAGPALREVYEKDRQHQLALREEARRAQHDQQQARQQQRQQFGQQMDLAQFQQRQREWEQEPARQAQQVEQRVQAQAKLHEIELSQSEKNRLARLKQQVAYVRERGPTTEGGTGEFDKGYVERVTMELMTGIDPLEKRASEAMQKQREQQTKLLEEKAKQEAIQTATFNAMISRANKDGHVPVVNPATRQPELLQWTGTKWEPVFPPGKAGPGDDDRAAAFRKDYDAVYKSMTTKDLAGATKYPSHAEVVGYLRQRDAAQRQYLGGGPDQGMAPAASAVRTRPDGPARPVGPNGQSLPAAIQQAGQPQPPRPAADPFSRIQDSADLWDQMSGP